MYWVFRQVVSYIVLDFTQYVDMTNLNKPGEPRQFVSNLTYGLYAFNGMFRGTTRNKSARPYVIST